MNASLQRYLLLGLGAVWCVLILMRILTAEAPQEVPLTFVSGKPAAKTRTAVGAPDPWKVKRVSMQAREMPEGPKKNIFATLGESTAVGATIIGPNVPNERRRHRRNRRWLPLCSSPLHLPCGCCYSAARSTGADS